MARGISNTTIQILLIDKPIPETANIIPRYRGFLDHLKIPDVTILVVGLPGADGCSSLLNSVFARMITTIPITNNVAPAAIWNAVGKEIGMVLGKKYSRAKPKARVAKIMKSVVCQNEVCAEFCSIVNL